MTSQFHLDCSPDNSGLPDTVIDQLDSEDQCSTTSGSKPESLEDEVLHLKSENSILKDRLWQLQQELVDSRNEMDRWHNTLRTISSLRKPLRQPPPEILVMIFDRTIPPSFLVDASASHTLNPIWGKALRQKLAVINVCKIWHDVGLPLLYEDICVQHIPQLRLLLRTLETPETDINKFVKALSFNCLVPEWNGSRFVQRLKLLFDLCPNITSFSYLSSCPLPSPQTFSVLPSHVTHLQLVHGVSIPLMNNVLNVVSHNIISLSIHIPFAEDALQDQGGHVFCFRKLEALSIGVTSTTIGSLEHFCLTWKMPLLCRLTFRVHGAGLGWQNDYSLEPFNIFCQNHASDGLKFLHIHPEYLWSMQRLNLHMQSLLDLCPNLEHIVVHPSNVSALTHPRVKWVDIWTSHVLSDCKESWQSMRDSITKSTFPSLQGIRYLSSSLAFVSDLPLILPPGHVSKHQDSFAYTFLEMDVHHNVGEIYRVLPPEDGASDDDDSDFVPESSGSDDESEVSNLVDWDAELRGELTEEWHADTDL